MSKSRPIPKCQNNSWFSIKREEQQIINQNLSISFVGLKFCSQHEKTHAIVLYSEIRQGSNHNFNSAQYECCNLTMGSSISNLLDYFQGQILHVSDGES